MAGDVFIYVGAVETPLRDAFKVLKRGGWIFFSCERAPEDGPDLVLERAFAIRTRPVMCARCSTSSAMLPPSSGISTCAPRTVLPFPDFIVSAQKPLWRDQPSCQLSSTTALSLRFHRGRCLTCRRATRSSSVTGGEYQRHQIERENELLQPGVAFELTRKLPASQRGWG